MPLWGEGHDCTLATLSEKSMDESEQLKRVLRETVELRAELERLRNATAASSQISALPERHQSVLESARETLDVLTRLNVELRKSLKVSIRPGLTL